MKYYVNGVKVSLIEDETLVAGSVGLHLAEFDFDESWDEYDTIIAVFVNGDIEREQILTGGKCDIPWEVIAESGSLRVGVYGKTEDKMRPTLWAIDKTVHDGAEAAESAAEPSRDIWQQLLDELKRIAGADPTVIEPIVYAYLNANKADYKGDPGDNYVLTEADKVEIAQRAANPLAALVTLAADGWTNDSDTFANIKKIRIGYCTTEDTATDKHVYVAGIGSELVPTYEWVTYSYAFTLSEDAPAFAPLFRGGTSVNHVHPYDLMDVKVYAASDSAKTNLMSDDIEVQNYKGSRTDVKHAIAISDGVKYMHVFRQPINHVWMIAKGTTALLAGDYVLEFKLRLTPWKYTYVAPVPEAHSEYVITVAPLADSVAAYNGSDIYCAAFGSQQLIFVADSIPTSDIGVGCTVIKAAGAQGIIIQPPRAVLPAAEDVTEGF